MKKRRFDVWKSHAKQLIAALRFGEMDEDAQACVNSEHFYFNHSRCVPLSLAIIVIETLNIANVLFFSKSGLATQNNRQYFLMYLLLFLSGVACLVVRRLLQNKAKLLSRCYVGFVAFWMAWHAVLSAMDLRKNPSITVFITGIFGLSLLVRLKPKQTFIILPGGFLLLMACANSNLTDGIIVNALIVTLVAVLISCSRYFSTIEELDYRKKLVKQADHRIKEQQELKQLRDRLEQLEPKEQAEYIGG